MKRSLSASWIAFLALLSAVGCSVSENGLTNRRDASDGPKPTSDARLDSNSDASPSLSETRPADAVAGDAPAVSPDQALFPDDAKPGPDLVAKDFGRADDAPSGFEVAPDALLVFDGSNEPFPSRVDGPVTVPGDAPLLDAVLTDSTPRDLPRVDLAQDLPLADLARDLPLFTDLPARDLASPDLGAPDLPPPDLAPLPTVDWVVDNTTSIGGNTPTVMGSPTVTTSDAGTFLCFDGTEDGLLFGTNPIEGMQQFTIQILVYPEFTATSEPQSRLVHIGDPNSPNRRMTIQMRLEASGNWHAVVGFAWDTNSANIDDTGYSHPSGQWYWLAVTYDGQTARVYVNGVLENSADTSYGPLGAGAISLATRQNSQNFFPGCIRDVEFFNSALVPSRLHKP